MNGVDLLTGKGQIGGGRARDIARFTEANLLETLQPGDAGDFLAIGLAGRDEECTEAKEPT